MVKVIFSIALFAILTTLSIAGTIDPNVNDQKYIEYGSKHECVVSIFGKTKKDQTFFASAVLIRPKIILTAAHVIKDTSDSFIKFKDKDIKIECAIYPNAFDENDISKFDIAICLLKEPCDLDFFPELYNNDDELGKVCSISGFGMNGTYDKGIMSYDGKKRAGANIVEEISDDMLFCTLSNQKTNLELLASVGDSGGGLFINKKLAGINSIVWTKEKNGKLDSNLLDGSGHTRISLHIDWINKLIAILEKVEQ
jgi:hypothetical protein